MDDYSDLIESNDYENEVEEHINEQKQLSRYCKWYQPDLIEKKERYKNQSLNLKELDAATNFIKSIEEMKDDDFKKKRKELESNFKTAMKHLVYYESKNRTDSLRNEKDYNEISERLHKDPSMIIQFMEGDYSKKDNSDDYDRIKKNILNSDEFVKFKSFFYDKDKKIIIKEPETANDEELTEIMLLEKLIKLKIFNFNEQVFSSLKKDVDKLDMPQTKPYLYLMKVSYLINKYNRNKCMDVFAWKSAVDTFKTAIKLFFESKDKKFNLESDDRIKEDYIKIIQTTPQKIINIFLSLFDEMKCICQNFESGDFSSCFFCECSIVSVGHDLLNQFIDTDCSLVAYKLLSVLCNRSKEMTEILNLHFPSTNVKTFTVYELWKISAKRENFDAMLCYAYFLAINDDIEECNDIISQAQSIRFKQFFKTSEIFAITEKVSVTTKILFNRLILQLGLAYFRRGNIAEGFQIIKSLREDRNWIVQIGQKVPYIDDQGEARARICMLFSSISVVPHYHISTEMIDLLYYICSSMEKALQIVKSQVNQKNELNAFDHFLRSTKSLLVGPPELPKDYILAMYEAILRANTSRAFECLCSIPIWTESFKHEPFSNRLKETCLKVFLYTEAINFETLTIDYIINRFMVTNEVARQIINEALLERESSLVAFWDSTEKAIYFERGNATQLHRHIEEVTHNCTLLDTPLQQKEIRRKNRRNY